MSAINTVIIDTTKGTLFSCNNSDPYPKFMLYDTFEDTITRNIRQSGRWEYDLMETVKPFIKRDSIVCDIGSNLGSWSVYMSKCVDLSGHVYAFEPQKMVYYQLCGNLFLNQCTNVTAHQVALGTHEQNNETIQLTSVDPTNIGGTKIFDSFPNNEHPEHTTVGSITTIRSLDSYNISPQFLKIDVEGYELNVLKGAQQTLERAQYPPFVFEAWLWPSFREEKEKLFQYICSLGYKIKHIKNDDHLAIYDKYDMP